MQAKACGQELGSLNSQKTDGGSQRHRRYGERRFPAKSTRSLEQNAMNNSSTSTKLAAALLIVSLAGSAMAQDIAGGASTMGRDISGGASVMLASAEVEAKLGKG